MPAKSPNLKNLVNLIKDAGHDLGFQEIGISHTKLDQASKQLDAWLSRHYHGSMTYMARHGQKRTQPDKLVPGTLSVISARLEYLPELVAAMEAALQDSSRAYISRYALGRDYHKVMRKRLQKLARVIEERIGQFGYRVYCDSAPVLEKPLANQAGLGWIGKHTNLIAYKHGSWFFLGEIYTDLPLPADPPVSTSHCGSCTACINACPTKAIVAPYQLDARRCISYLTIELDGPIPEQFRQAIGNRIYGCDDCQLVCPWNRHARLTVETDFLPRHGLDQAGLLELFAWDEATFLAKTEGSPLRRLGHTRWLRNIAVALGNAPASDRIIKALQQRSNHPSALVRDHVQWALLQQTRVGSSTSTE